MVITPAQMYQELRQVHDEVKACRADLKTLKNHGTQLGDHETRIRALEYRVWWLSGAASVAGAALGQLLP